MRRAPGRVARRSGAEVSTGGTRLARRVRGDRGRAAEYAAVYRRRERERALGLRGRQRLHLLA